MDQFDVVFGASSSHRVAGDIFVWRRPTKAARVQVAPTAGMESTPARAMDPITHQKSEPASQKLTAPRHLTTVLPSIPPSSRQVTIRTPDSKKRGCLSSSTYFFLLHVALVALFMLAAVTYYPVVSQYVFQSTSVPSLVMSGAVGTPSSGNKDTSEGDDVGENAMMYDFVMI